MAISAEKAFDHTKLPFQPFTYMSNDNPRNKRLLLSFMQHQELMDYLIGIPQADPALPRILPPEPAAPPPNANAAAREAYITAVRLHNSKINYVWLILLYMAGKDFNSVLTPQMEAGITLERTTHF